MEFLKKIIEDIKNERCNKKFINLFKKEEPFFYGNSNLKDSFFQNYFIVHILLQIGH